MPGYNVLNDELTRAVKQVTAQHLSSFMPRPKRGRRPRRNSGGAGTVSVSGVLYARVSGEIPPALSQLPADWGQGQVKILNLATGVVAPEQHVVGNFLDTGFVVDALVELMAVPPGVVGAEGLDYLVANGTCHAYPWKEPA